MKYFDNGWCDVRASGTNEPSGFVVGFAFACPRTVYFTHHAHHD